MHTMVYFHVDTGYSHVFARASFLAICILFCVFVLMAINAYAVASILPLSFRIEGEYLDLEEHTFVYYRRTPWDIARETAKLTIFVLPAASALFIFWLVCCACTYVNSIYFKFYRAGLEQWKSKVKEYVKSCPSKKVYYIEMYDRFHDITEIEGYNIFKHPRDDCFGLTKLDFNDYLAHISQDFPKLTYIEGKFVLKSEQGKKNKPEELA